MKMTQIRYVLETARLGSFSAAAERLYVAQPTLSQQIRLLEKEIGTPLFRRTTREVALTPAGREFVRLAQEADEHFSRLEELAKKFASPLAGPLRLGLLWSFTYLKIDKLLAAFAHEYPEITLEYEIGGSLELAEKLRGGWLDLVFSNVRGDEEFFTSMAVSESPVCAVVSRENPLCSKKKLRAADFAGQKVLLPGEKSTLERAVSAFLQPVEASIRVIGRSQQIDVCWHVAASNIAISFLSRDSASYWRDEGARAVPLSPEMKRTTYLVAPKNASQTARTFVNFARDFPFKGKL